MMKDLNRDWLTHNTGVNAVTPELVSHLFGSHAALGLG